MFLVFLISLSALWVASEVLLAVVWRSPSSARRHDAGTLRLLNVVIYASITCGFVLSASGVGRVALPGLLLWSGLAVIVAGLALRWWAVFSLRRLFTVDVAIQPDHELIRKGPYRHVRHPAYAGVLLSFLGLAICTSSWISALVILVPITAVFLHRVRVEERVLAEAFPEDYRLYSARTSRLVPGIY